MREREREFRKKQTKTTLKKKIHCNNNENRNNRNEESRSRSSTSDIKNDIATDISGIRRHGKFGVENDNEHFNGAGAVAARLGDAALERRGVEGPAEIGAA